MTPPPPAGYAGREVTHPPDWHGLVVWDVFLNALTTGLFLVAAVAELARPDLFAAVAWWAYPVALVVLLADLACLVLDLGDPLRFHHMLRVFKPSSPMSLGTWCLTAYSLPLTALVGVDLLVTYGGPAVPGWVRMSLLVAALPVAFGSAAYKGVLFSTTAQPGWRDARWLGAYHIASALAVGCAALVVVAVATGEFRGAAGLQPALAALVALAAVPTALLAAELWPALARRYTRGYLLGVAALCFGGGVVFPLVVLLAADGRGWAALAAGLVLAGGWIARRVVVLLPQHGTDHV